MMGHSHGRPWNHQSVRTITGIVLLIVGVVWILQGFDVAFAPQSFMTDNRQWVLWGGLAAGVGAALIWWGRRDGE